MCPCFEHGSPASSAPLSQGWRLRSGIGTGSGGGGSGGSSSSSSGRDSSSGVTAGHPCSASAWGPWGRGCDGVGSTSGACVRRVRTARSFGPSGGHVSTRTFAAAAEAAGGYGGGANTCGGGGSSGGGGGSGEAEAPLQHFQYYSATATHYEVLGVPRDASLAAIKAAFRQRAKELHPDAVAARARGQRPQARHDSQHGQQQRQHESGRTATAGQHRHPAQPRQQPRKQPREQPGAPAGVGGDTGAALSESQREAGAAAFLRLMSAYEVLTSPYDRRAYDMQLAAAAAGRQSGGGGGGPLGRHRTAPPAAGTAAADAGRGGGAAADGAESGFSGGGGGAGGGGTSGGGGGGGGGAAGQSLQHIDFRSWRYGVGKWMMRPRREPMEGRSAALEYYLRKYSSEFEGALHAALVKAYLGPKLALGPGELPRCFEGELRSRPGGGEALMQLVSGRTVLGSVRVRETPALGPGFASGSGSRAQQLDPESTAAAALPTEAAAAAGEPGLLSERSAAGTHVATTVASMSTGREVGATGGGAAVAPAAFPRPPDASGPRGGHPEAPHSGADVAPALPGLAAGLVSASQAAAPTPPPDVALPAAPAPSHPMQLPQLPQFGAGAQAVRHVGGGSGPAAAAAAVGVPAASAGPHDPLNGLDAAALRRLTLYDGGSDAGAAAVVQLAAAAIAAERDATASAAGGYGHLAPGYSRLRGMLDLYGFYPDPAAIQRRSVRISLVTAAEGAQRRDSSGALGGRRLLKDWHRNAGAAAAATSGGAAAAAAASGAAAAAGGGGDGGGQEVSAPVAAGGAASRWDEENEDRVDDGGVPAGVMPPPQLQALAEAAREAEAAEAAALAAAAAATSSGPSRPPPPRNDPRTWAFGPGYDLPDLRCSSGGGGGGAAAGGGGGAAASGAAGGGGGETVLELHLGQELAAVAVHQPWARPAAGGAAGAAAAGGGGGGGGATTTQPSPYFSSGSGSGSGFRPSGPQNPLDFVDPDSTVVPLFGPVIEGRVKVYVDGRLEAGVEGRHVYDAEGRRVALMVRGAFPGLRTMHFFDATSRRLRLLCRCVRARLLPSPTWLFPPRSETHDIGGWYFEWGGYGRRGHPGWLHPAVYVFVAALVAAEQERVAGARRAAAAQVLDSWRAAAARALGPLWRRRR